MFEHKETSKCGWLYRAPGSAVIMFGKYLDQRVADSVVGTKLWNYFDNDPKLYGVQYWSKPSYSLDLDPLYKMQDVSPEAGVVCTMLSRVISICDSAPGRTKYWRSGQGQARELNKFIEYCERLLTNKPLICTTSSRWKCKGEVQYRYIGPGRAWPHCEYHAAELQAISETWPKR